MFFKFEDFIGEVPGKSATFFALFNDLAKTSISLEDTALDLRNCLHKAPSWEGKAHDTFEDKLYDKIKQGFRVSEGTETGSDAVKKYAYVLLSAERNIESARIKMRAFDKEIEQADDKIEKWKELLPEAQIVANDAHSEMEKLQKAASVCAAELRAALHLEAIEIKDGGKDIGELKSLEDDDITRINHELKHLNFRTGSQGAIGDCYLLASILTMMRSHKGRQFIQNSSNPIMMQMVGRMGTS